MHATPGEMKSFRSSADRIALMVAECRSGRKEPRASWNKEWRISGTTLVVYERRKELESSKGFLKRSSWRNSNAKNQRALRALSSVAISALISSDRPMAGARGADWLQ